MINHGIFYWKLLFPTVPPPVENITIMPKNPNTVEVTWPLPKTPNGPIEKIIYYVKWTTQLQDGLHERMSDAILYHPEEESYNGLLKKEITDLEADQTYSMKVGGEQLYHRK